MALEPLRCPKLVRESECSGTQARLPASEVRPYTNLIAWVRDTLLAGGRMSDHTKYDEAESAAGSQNGLVRAGRTPGKHRHQEIYETLLEEIRTGVYKPGERLPSEALLCERFEASRITVAKAFQTLQRDGRVRRIPGSGTYVEEPPSSASMQFGLLIPDLGSTEIFEAICQGLMQSPAARSHSLTWGNALGEKGSMETTENLCRQYIEQNVSGVFFAPAEFAQDAVRANTRIANMLQQAGIPVVLLDRCFRPYPERSMFDLVGVDNHRVGYLQAQHLIQCGSRKVIYAYRPNSAGTVNARVAGYREGLHALLHTSESNEVAGDFEDVAFVKSFMEKHSPDGIACANDLTAARLMRTIISLGYRVPEDIRMVGVDDVNYGRFLPTPLTTVRQDCSEIGRVAMAMMLYRLERPDHPVVDVRVNAELVVRESCGHRLRPRA